MDAVYNGLTEFILVSGAISLKSRKQWRLALVIGILAGLIAFLLALVLELDADFILCIHIYGPLGRMRKCLDPHRWQ
jgi:hypothetical protein